MEWKVVGDQKSIGVPTPPPATHQVWFHGTSSAPSPGSEVRYAHAYLRILDTEEPLEPGDILSYDIWFEDLPGGHPIGIDLRYTDGTFLRGTRPLDQYGQSAHPNGRAQYPTGRWHTFHIDLKLQEPRTLKEVVVAYDNQADAKYGDFGAYVANIQIGSRPTIRPVSQGYRYRSSDEVDGWRLIERLGAGGTSEVWLGNRAGVDQAVKFLHDLDPDSELYQRFQREIEVQKELGALPGILPLLDSSLPSQPSAAEPAWISMPRTTPISSKLDSLGSVTDIVSGVLAIAEALTLCHEKGICHRDIKPPNLFLWNGQWVVGDFGLAKQPQDHTLTGSGKLGPGPYIPFEMAVSPADADGKAADVFLLAKTLWVLLTGLPAPPGGHLRVDDPVTTLSNRVQLDRPGVLDALMDRATANEPKNRLSMSEFAAELREWLTNREPPASPDKRELPDRVKSKFLKVRRANERQNRMTTIGEGLFQESLAVRNKIAERLEQVTQLTLFDDFDDRIIPLYASGGSTGSPTPIWSQCWSIGVRTHTAPGSLSGYLFGCLLLEMFQDEMVRLAAFYEKGSVMDDQFLPGGTETTWGSDETAAAGSGELRNNVDSVHRGLLENLDSAIERFSVSLDT